MHLRCLVQISNSLSRAREFFSSSHLLTIYKSQIRPSLEYCSHVWGGAPKSTLCLLDKVQFKAIRLTNKPNATLSLQPLSHCRLVGDLSIFYIYFHGHYSQEVRDIIPVPLRHFRTSRSSTDAHQSKLWNLIHESYLFQSPTTSYFKSKIIHDLDTISTYKVVKCDCKKFSHEKVSFAVTFVGQRNARYMPSTSCPNIIYMMDDMLH